MVTFLMGRDVDVEAVQRLRLVRNQQPLVHEPILLVELRHDIDRQHGNPHENHQLNKLDEFEGRGERANPTSDQVEAAKSKALLVNGSKELEGKSGLLSGARDLESLEEGQKLLKSLEGEAPASKQAI